MDRFKMGENLGKLMASHQTRETEKFFYTEKFKWVDIKHFALFADMALKEGSFMSWLKGIGLEIRQATRAEMRDSAFSEEDLLSNQAGRDFAREVRRVCKLLGLQYGQDRETDRKILTTAYRWWTGRVGGRQLQEIQEEVKKLPEQPGRPRWRAVNPGLP
jgi:hypothetical protein